MDLRKLLLESPLSRMQIIVIAIITALNGLDGFDILSITFAAPGISQEWGIQRAALGIVFSAGLAGMAFGAAALAGIGDIFGRRPALLMFLVTVTAGMFATATAPDIVTLTVCRFVTGLGIGGLIAVLNVLAAEHANAARRSLAVAVATTGFSLGTMLGGLLAARLLLHFDWRAIFVFGGTASLLAFFVVLALVPETIEFLLSRQGPDTLRRVNAILLRMRRTPVTQLPAPLQVARVPILRIMRGDLLPVVMLLTAAYLLLVMTFYYVAAWVPQFARDLGAGPPDIANLAALISGSGVLGTIAVGVLARPVGLARLTLITVIASSVAIASIGVLPDGLGSFAAAAAIAGFFVFASFTCIYALIVQSFSTAVRTTACGFVVGIGRIGAVASPILVGGLLGAGFNVAFVCYLMAGCGLLAALAVFSLQRLSGRAAPALARVLDGQR